MLDKVTLLDSGLEIAKLWNFQGLDYPAQKKGESHGRPPFKPTPPVSLKRMWQHEQRTGDSEKKNSEKLVVKNRPTNEFNERIKRIFRVQKGNCKCSKSLAEDYIILDLVLSYLDRIHKLKGF